MKIENKILKLLKEGLEIYDKQPRYLDYDYHPQKITNIGKTTIHVYEAGYFPNGREFEVNISSLFLDTFDGEEIICH